jgi:hypothetical protein
VAHPTNSARAKMAGGPPCGHRCSNPARQSSSLLLFRADRQRGDGLGADPEVAIEANSAVNHLAFDTILCQRKGAPLVGGVRLGSVLIRDLVMTPAMVALFLALTVRRAN